MPTAAPRRSRAAVRGCSCLGSVGGTPTAGAFFRGACATRTCPAPDVADSNITRGFAFICQEFPAKASGIRMSCAVPRQFFPEFRVQLFAAPRTASGSPENRGSRAARPAAPAWSAESCPAVLRDAEAAPLPAIPRAQSWRRSDTWLPPTERLFYGIVLSCCRERGVTRKLGEEILRGSRRRRHKLIARDFRGNAQPAVLSALDPHNLSQAADLYIA